MHRVPQGDYGYHQRPLCRDIRVVDKDTLKKVECPRIIEGSTHPSAVMTTCRAYLYERAYESPQFSPQEQTITTGLAHTVYHDLEQDTDDRNIAAC